MKKGNSSDRPAASTGKKPKRRIVLAVVLILLILAIVGDLLGNSETDPVPPISGADASTTENPLMVADFKTGDIFNGFQTEKIGEFGYIEISKCDMETITGEQLTEFCKDKVDGSGLNWVGIVFEDGSGLHVIPGSWWASIPYGSIDVSAATFSDQIGAVVVKSWSDDGSTPMAYEYISFEELHEIQTAVENLVSSEYDGFYSCTVDFCDDNAGYNVSILIDDLDEIGPMEELINSLEDPRIVDVSVTAMKDGKLLGTN